MKKSKCSKFLTVFQLYIFLQISLAVLDFDVAEYCAKFPENLRPIICILRENKLVPRRSSSSTTQDPRTTNWPENESESEEDEEEPTCGCDLTCFPPPDAMNTSEENSNLHCRPCGNHCDVTTAVNPRCSCAAVGSGLSSSSGARQQRCSCGVTCASNQWQNQEPFCIFNVTGLQSSGDPRPARCECCKSKLAENSDYPDFVCICQRV